MFKYVMADTQELNNRLMTAVLGQETEVSIDEFISMNGKIFIDQDDGTVDMFCQCPNITLVWENHRIPLSERVRDVYTENGYTGFCEGSTLAGYISDPDFWYCMSVNSHESIDILSFTQEQQEFLNENSSGSLYED